MAKDEKTFLISDLAEELEVKPATARGLLRAAKIEKDGKQYEWGKTKFAEIVKKLSASKSAKPAKDEKPAAKGKAAKPAPKGKKAKVAEEVTEDA